MRFRWLATSILGLVTVVQLGCAAGRLLGYAVAPGAPELPTARVPLAGLRAPVEVRRTRDGVWHVAAASEEDAYRVLGFLQAYDRAFQMDLLRHMARGELAALLGEVPMGHDGRTTLDLDRLHRFLGFQAEAVRLWRNLSPTGRRLLAAFADGVNQWLLRGPRSLEHRLLGVERIRPWTPADSLAIYAFFSYSLAADMTREVRRLLIACRAGVAAVEELWPSLLEPEHAFLPPEVWRGRRYRIPPAILPEVAAELERSCPQPAGGEVTVAGAGSPLTHLLAGVVASNNWVVAGRFTRSGKPILANDPHLPHMSPPLLWAYEVTVPTYRAAGFTIAGLHLLAFGHTDHVAWGQTTDHMDRQDLYLLRELDRDHYAWESSAVPYEVRSAYFEVRGRSRPVRQAARFTRWGPVLNDLDPVVARWAPPVALHRVGVGRALDVDAARRLLLARDVTEAAEAIADIDGNCSNWVLADTGGHIAYVSPCRVPIRRGWLGTFPAPGWTGRYAWAGFVTKHVLPASFDPERGWLITANDRPIPADAFFTPLHNGVVSRRRFERIRERLTTALRAGPVDVTAMAAIQTDLLLPAWRTIRRAADASICSPRWRPEERLVAAVRERFCAWDGTLGASSTVAGLFVLWTHALLDLAMADRFPWGATDPVWRYVQGIYQFEGVVQRLWELPADDPLWDDVRTPEREGRDEMWRRAFVAAVAEARRRWGPDPDAWAWGSVRPFRPRHPFSGVGGLVAALVDPDPVPGAGEPTTVAKFQFLRADRERLEPGLGAVFRVVVDMADPHGAIYAFAGGESGWPRDRYYANLLPDWRAGRTAPLQPGSEADAARWRFVPAHNVE